MPNATVVGAAAATAVLVALYFGPWTPLTWQEWVGFARLASAKPPPNPADFTAAAAVPIAIVIPARCCEPVVELQATINRLRDRSEFPQRISIILVLEPKIQPLPPHQAACLARMDYTGFASDSKTVSAPAHGSGRGAALNEGVRHIPSSSSSSSLVLFCHADTTLPTRFDSLIAASLAQDSVLMCAFSFGFAKEEEEEDGSMLLRLVQHSANMRSRFWWMPYGDQALGFRLDVFLHAFGGFRDEYKMMEDFDLVRRVRSRALLSGGERIDILPQHVETSARRWKQRGVIRTTALNWFFCAAFVYGGMRPDRIAHMYYGKA